MSRYHTSSTEDCARITGVKLWVLLSKHKSREANTTQVLLKIHKGKSVYESMSGTQRFRPSKASK